MSTLRHGFQRKIEVGRMARNWRFIIYATLALVYAAAIFVLSSMPTIPMPPEYYEVPNVDKLLHTLLYFGLGILLCFAFHNASNPKISERAIHFSLLIGILYGIFDEVHQWFVPGRAATLIDVAFNTLGVLIALLAFLIWKRWKIKKSEKKDSQL